MKRFFSITIIFFLVLGMLNTSCKKDENNTNTPPAETLPVNIGGDKTIHEGDSVILDAGNSGSSFQWSTGANTQKLVVDTSGTFWVKVTNGNKVGYDTVVITLSYKLTKIETDYGAMLIWLYPQTPLHRANFISLVSQGFYDSLIFHRVIPNFVNQGGDPLGTGFGGPGYTIPAEFRANLKHVYGAVGAARMGDDVNPNKESNGSQFYIVNNKSGLSYLNGNYTVFGIVIDGLNAVDAISIVPTNPSNNKPLDDVYMTRVTILYYTPQELKNNFGFDIP